MMGFDPMTQLFLGLGQSAGQALNPQPILERQALEDLFGGGRQPTLEEILSSQLSPDRAQNIAKTLGESRIKGQEATRKQQEQALKLQQEQEDIQAINEERIRRGQAPLPSNITPATARSLTQPDPFESTGDVELAKFLSDRRKEIIKKTDFAKKASEKLGNIASLSAKGKGVAGNVKALLRFFGYDIPEDADESMIAQATTELWSGLRDAVGSIRFKTEFDKYTSTLPDLLKLPGVREKLAKNMKEAFDLDVQRGNIYRELLKENGGKPYFGIEDDAEAIWEQRFGEEATRIGDKLEEIFEGESELEKIDAILRRRGQNI